MQEERCEQQGSTSYGPQTKSAARLRRVSEKVACKKPKGIHQFKPPKRTPKALQQEHNTNATSLCYPKRSPAQPQVTPQLTTLIHPHAHPIQTHYPTTPPAYLAPDTPPSYKTHHPTCTHLHPTHPPHPHVRASTLSQHDPAPITGHPTPTHRGPPPWAAAPLLVQPPPRPSPLSTGARTRTKHIAVNPRARGTAWPPPTPCQLDWRR